MKQPTVWIPSLLLTLFISSFGNAQAVMNEIYSRGTVGDPDWIEIFNGSEAPLDVSGYRIYDAAGNNGTKPKKLIPNGTIVPAYGYHVVLTEDGTTDAANFGLSSTGEWVWLENPAGTVVDSVSFAAMTETQSYGRLPDGSVQWRLLNYRSKGGPNSEQQPVAVVMNEIYSRGTAAAPDWIELYNTSSLAANIGGFTIYDSGGKNGSIPKKVIVAGTTIAAKGYLVVQTDGSGDAGDFGLSSSGEWVWLEDPTGIVTDSVAFPALDSGRSFGRIADGAPYWEIAGTVTKGSSNNPHPSVPVALTVSGTLPPVLYESSGLATTVPGKFWSHNDAGHANKLHCFTSTGQLLRTITIHNALSIDWEDLATDDQNRIYVEDAGNNFNNRKDLAVYRIPDPESFTADSVAAGIIRFSFEDQTGFPPPAAEANFDVEAMVWFSDSLFLFTKDRSSPLSGFTKLYALPADTGTHVARLRGSYYTGSTIASALVTSADLHRASGTLALLVKERLIVFRNFPQTRFFDGGVTEYPFVSVPGQAEAIVFTSASTLAMTEEGTSAKPGNLYAISLTPAGVAADRPAVPTGPELEQNFPNPFNPATSFVFTVPVTARTTLKVYTVLGQEVATVFDGVAEAGHSHAAVFDATRFSSGVYIARLQSGDGIQMRKMVLMK